MAEVRCPMCGKTNPPGREECQYCQARLRPVWESQPEPVQPNGEEDLPDWLRTLRLDDEPAASGTEQKPAAPDHQTASPAPPPADDAGSDWLAGLRAGTAQEEDLLPDDTSDEDWWSEPEESDQARSNTPEEFPGWLSDMRPKESPAQPVEPASGPEPAEDDLAWLAGFELGSERQSDAAQEPAGPGQPDWFQEISPKEKPEPAGEDIPGWWLEEQSPAPTRQEELPGVPSAASEEIPDWLAEFSGEEQAEQQPAAADDQLDWMTAAQAGAQNAEAELPDWLADFQSEPAKDQDELPEWLQAQAKATPASQAETEPAPMPEQEAWQGFAETPAGAAEEPAEAAGELPDWLVEMSAPISSDAPDRAGTPVEPGLPSAEEEPDWLAAFSDAGELEAQLSEPGAQAYDTGPSDSPFAPPVPTEEEDLPEWMKGLTGEAPPVTSTSAEPLEAVPAEFDDEELAWLKDLELETPGIPAEPRSVPAFMEDFTASQEETPAVQGELPNWLMSAAPGSQPESQQPGGEQPAPEEPAQPPQKPGESEIAPAELPSWLEAMRPVGSAVGAVASGEGRDRPVEKAGPLAGLQGVLPAEPPIGQIQKPPTYTYRLQVSDGQKAHAAMLESLVKSEGETRPPARRRRNAPQALLRILIALILLATVLIPLVIEIPGMAPPAVTDESAVASQVVERVPSGAPVLVVVDFTPAFSAELEAAALPVIDHLMLKGASLALVSTNSIGPVQAEHLIGLANRSGSHQYTAGSHYTNLGFIPGGSTGLQSFVQSPRATLPMDIHNLPGWSSAGLQGVNRLADFNLVVAIVESPDIARMWIEQVQPALGGIPFLVVASAQAEPLIRPYYDGGADQVQGLVAGLAGGKAYEAMQGRSLTTVSGWNAFSLAVLSGSGLMVLAGLVGALSGLWSNRKAESEGEAAK